MRPSIEAFLDKSVNIRYTTGNTVIICGIHTQVHQGFTPVKQDGLFFITF